MSPPPTRRQSRLAVTLITFLSLAFVALYQFRPLEDSAADPQTQLRWPPPSSIIDGQANDLSTVRSSPSVVPPPPSAQEENHADYDTDDNDEDLIPSSNSSSSRSYRIINVASNYKPTNKLALAHARTTCQIDSAVRQVVLLRICGALRPAIKEELEKYAQELSDDQAYDFWLMYDTVDKKVFNESLLLPFYALQRRFPHMGLFIYNWDSVRPLFPKASYLKKSSHVNWWFHDASLMLWGHVCYPTFFTSRPFTISTTPGEPPRLPVFIWSLEPDAVFLGNLARFIDDHANLTSDYIGRFTPMPVNWMHKSKSTWQVAAEDTLMKRDFVERYSLDLLRYMETVVRMNFIGYGEAFAVTVCHLQDDWCVISQLADRYIGSVYRTLDITDEQFEVIQKDPNEQGKWLHALKSRKSIGCLHSS